MKYYVQFSHVVDDELQELCGSDGVFLLDGRNNISTMRCDAQARIAQLQNVQDIEAYKIMKGERFDDATCLYEWTRIGCLSKHANSREINW